MSYDDGVVMKPKPKSLPRLARFCATLLTSQKAANMTAIRAMICRKVDR